MTQLSPAAGFLPPPPRGVEALPATSDLPAALASRQKPSPGKGRSGSMGPGCGPGADKQARLRKERNGFTQTSCHFGLQTSALKCLSPWDVGVLVVFSFSGLFFFPGEMRLGSLTHQAI